MHRFPWKIFWSGATGWTAFDIYKNVGNQKYVLFHVLRYSYDLCTDAQLMTSVKQIAIQLYCFDTTSIMSPY